MDVEELEKQVSLVMVGRDPTALKQSDVEIRIVPRAVAGESHCDKPSCFNQVVLGWKALNMQEKSL